jgi:drug/metabolite transporter (DMT)-like permease
MVLLYAMFFTERGTILVGKWAAFWLLGLIWGSSFLLIRVGVEEVSPFEVVFIRTAIAAIGLNAILLLRGKHVPLNPRQFLPFIVIGVGNTVIPFTLISWGETQVESGLASVLNATAALFTLVIAHLTFQDERITAQKVIGLLVGFFGVVVLTSRSWVDGQVVLGNLAGQLAIVLASFFYAYFGVYSRKVMKDRYEPMQVAAGSMIVACVVSGILMMIAPYFNGQPPKPLSELSADARNALLLLGLVNTFIAYILYYWIIRELGAARASMVTYVTPAIAILLGTLILDETLDWRLLLGAALILSGIAVVNLKGFARRRVEPLPGEA